MASRIKMASMVPDHKRHTRMAIGLKKFFFQDLLQDLLRLFVKFAEDKKLLNEMVDPGRWLPQFRSHDIKKSVQIFNTRKKKSVTVPAVK